MDVNRQKKWEKCLDHLSAFCLLAVAVVGIFLTVFIVMAPKVWY